VASIWITRRQTSKGVERFDVRFEGPPVQRLDGTVRSRIHVGTFPSKREAETRARWARNEWAAGRIPDPDRIVAEQISRSGPLMRAVADDWLASRRAIAPLTRKNYARLLEHVVREFPGDPTVLTPLDVRHFIDDLMERYSPMSVGQVVAVLRMILDHAGVDPNPARHRTVELPAGSSGAVRMRIPSDAELVQIRAGIHQERYRRLLDFLEDSGVRISEACALRWDDVQADRIHVPGAKGPGGKVKWRWIDERLGGIRLLREEPGAGSVFGSTMPGFRNGLEMACDRVGVRRYSPHDLRHLHASRLMSSDSPRVAEIAARLGHANASMLIEVYTHVIVPG
jgi:integrase/recombinase XerD